MPRPRKKHIQQAFEFRHHGGKREGAGRPRTSSRPRLPHAERDEINPRHPLHVTSRVVEGLGSLRKRDMYRAIRAATIAVFRFAAIREVDCRIIHASVQANHLHLLVEAASRDALTAGMRVFLSSAAKHINRAIWRRTGERRRGGVFADRYHDRALTTPREVRNCIAYVLNNWRRHGEDRRRNTNIDPFSTGIWFPGWKEREHAPSLYKPPPTYEALMMWLPKTWLLREGWKKHPLISVRDVPGPLPR